jgi:predicted SAM-dependent methyltransferase
MGSLERRIRLNLGCGRDRRSGYVNVDAYVPAVDARMSLGHLGFRPGTVDEILCSHVLEHFGKHEVPDLLRSWRDVLRPGGTLTVIVPDLPWCIRQWLRLPESERWGWSLDAIFGLQDHPGEFHKTGFSPERLGRLLLEAGFSSVGPDLHLL